jgi:hypothetical protein
MIETVLTYNVNNELLEKVSSKTEQNKDISYKPLPHLQELSTEITTETKRVIIFFDSLEISDQLLKQLKIVRNPLEIFIILQDEIDELQIKILLLKIKESNNKIAIITAKLSEFS